MFPTSFFPVTYFPGNYFPPGGGVEEEARKKGAGTAFRRPIIHIIEKELEEAGTVTAFSKAFQKAAKTVSTEEKRKVLAERAQAENLQGLGKIGKLSDDDIALILLLLD